MKRVFFVILSFILQLSLNAQPLITSSSTFSVLTNTPGDELYTAFGHDAFRFRDSLQKLDIVFNYGTFDFSDPDFYIKFVRGKLMYFLSVESFESFIISRLPMQSVYEQVLDLNNRQKQELLNFLINNLKPENRFYLYDFFYDNCATRIRDVLKTVIGDSLSFEKYKSIEEKSFRNLIDPYIRHNGWLDFGIDLAMGVPADRIALPYDYMFLPEHLMDALSKAQITEDNSEKPLVKNTIALVKNRYYPPVLVFYKSPVFIFWFFFIIVATLTILRFRKNKAFYIFDKIYFGALGFLGILLLFLWFGTDHSVMEKNLNLLWALPLHLPVVFFIRKSIHSKFLAWYFAGNFCLSLLLLLTWNWLPQQLPSAIVPLILISAIRSLQLFLANKSFK